MDCNAQGPHSGRSLLPDTLEQIDHDTIVKRMLVIPHETQPVRQRDRSVIAPLDHAGNCMAR